MLAPTPSRTSPRTGGAAGGVFAGARPVVSLLDFDPDLVAGLAPDDVPAAALASRAEVAILRKGRWEPQVPAAGAMGYLVLAGLIARIVRVGRRESLELLGPGDLLRPGHGDDASLVGCDVRWEVVDGARVAILDERFCRALRPWPQVGAALSDRALRRARWQAVQAAIDAHPTVEERLMLTLCHLADRMGRMTPEGIALDLPLSHRLLSHCVRALRPSVTAGLLRLRDDGRLLHPSRRTWIVTHEGLEYAAHLCRQPVVDC